MYKYTEKQNGILFLVVEISLQDLYQHVNIPIDSEIIERALALENQCQRHIKTITSSALTIENTQPVWHGQPNIYPWFETTLQKIIEAAKELTGNTELCVPAWWFNIGRPDQEYRLHAHKLLWRVGVFYVHVPKNSGVLELLTDENSVVTFEPKAGDFVIFPGRVWHRVLRNRSDQLRISVAFEFEES